MQSINQQVNDALDIGYAKTASTMLSSISKLTAAQTSRVQRSLSELDDEATRLDGLGERLEPDNAYLEKALTVLAIAFVAAGVLINDHSKSIQESGQALGPVAVTAKLFSQIMSTTGNPVMPDKLPGYVKKLASLGVDWNAPTALDFATEYVNTTAWAARMSKWGTGYGELIKQTVLEGIQKGWGPKYTAGKLRQYAENMPKSAAENLTRTLQLTSYRDASLAMEMMNGAFIIEKVRIATLDQRTCLACVALHGTVLQKGERIDDHYRGRCSEFYRVPGGDLFPSTMQSDSTPGHRRFVPWQNGEDWFASLPSARQALQRSMAATPAKLRAYQAGHSLSEFIGDYTDDLFGHQVVEQSLKATVGLGDATGYYQRNQAAMAQLNLLGGRISGASGETKWISGVNDIDICQRFIDARNLVKKQEVLSHSGAEELAKTGSKIFLSEDGNNGFIISKEGDLQNLFSLDHSGKENVREAIRQGAKTLDCFEPFLPGYYSEFGFVEVGRSANWTPGGPDVVFMELKK